MQKILVCLDGSKKETDVLDAAISLAGRTGAKLTLFRSVGMPSELPPAAYAMAVNDVPKLLQGQAEEALAQLAKRVPPALLAGCRVDVGNPWPSIERAAADENVDLIVVGSHGYHGLDKVLGTTAAKVVNHADRSVLVVRDPARLTR